MLTLEQSTQFNEILNELGNTLDISKTDFEAIERSYEAVGNWLAKEDSPLFPYNPIIAPQGSFIFGTIIKSVHEDDDIDIDLVCELTGKNFNWTQYDLKKIVGDRLKAHETYQRLLDDEGKRCWTLNYRKDSVKNDKYHMDILPSIIAIGYRDIVNKSFSMAVDSDTSKLHMRITDKTLPHYYTDTNSETWLKTNPFGLARWFYNIALVETDKVFSLREAVQPIPKYQTEKLPLQRVVQILKRHRDITFEGAVDKPISIIITTLAAKAYRRQTSIIEALIDVVDRMHLFIEERTNPITGRTYKYIANPTNAGENFADKWLTEPIKEKRFYEWLAQVKKDVASFSSLRGYSLQESLSKSFGKEVVSKTFSNIGNRTRILTEKGNGKFDPSLGIATSGLYSYKPHTFDGF